MRAEGSKRYYSDCREGVRRPNWLKARLPEAALSQMSSMVGGYGFECDWQGPLSTADASTRDGGVLNDSFSFSVCRTVGRRRGWKRDFPGGYFFSLAFSSAPKFVRGNSNACY